MTGGFARFSSAIARWAGSAWAFVVVSLAVVGWLGLGPVFGWSSRWQLAASTIATLTTFLMVFLIQSTQNRHSAAMQLKLDELISASENACEQLIGVDELPKSEIQGHRHELQGRRAGGTPERPRAQDRPI